MYIEILLTFSVVGGMVLYYWDDIQTSISILKGRMMFNMSETGMFSDKTKNKKERSLVVMLARLVGTTLGLKGVQYGYGLLLLSLFCAMSTFLILNKHIETGLMIAVCSFAFLLPILLLLCRLQLVRVKASREGEILLTELIDNYKINYYNMQQAIEVTALTIKEAPKSKRLLFNLTKGLNTVSRQEEIRNLLNDFEFALGTSWAVVLADNMFFALASGIRVTAAMEDLVNTVSQARKVSEYAKRENNESSLILKYLIPACYMLTIFGATEFFGLTLNEYMKYQFMTTVGMEWFVTSLLMYLIGVFLNFFLSKSKLDL